MHQFVQRSCLLTFPIANNPLSKKKRTPMKRKAIPKPARPTPISERQTEEAYYS